MIQISQPKTHTLAQAFDHAKHGSKGVATLSPPSPSPAFPYVYVLVREDITPAQQIVQACHAVLEAGFAAASAGRELCPECRMIICTVPDESALLRAAERLTCNDVAHALFFEPDDAMGYSALATHPLVGRERKAMAKYPLLRS